VFANSSVPANQSREGRDPLPEREGFRTGAMPDHNYFANLIWQIADLLRGPYRPPQYGLNPEIP
jgi:hypothetical protein